MKKRASKTKTAVKLKEPKRDRDLPVTKRLLDLKIQEVKGDITSLRLEMKAGFTKIDARFHQQDANISDVKSEVTEVKAQLSDVQTQITKMMIMMEDQNDRNRATIDSNALIYQKLIDSDSRFEKIEERMFGIKQR